MERNAMNPLVSVIIPNYNYAQYLDERMRSILNQTYQNFEIIILDDCSTDNSVEVIEKYRSHPKVSHIVYNEKNTGSTWKQWDRGISLTKGELIWIAEADDSCEATFLEELVQGYVLNPQCTFMYSDIMRIDENGNEMNKRYSDDIRTMISGERFIRNYLAFDFVIVNISSVVFSRKAVVEIGKEYIDWGHGWLFCIAVAERGCVFHVRKQLDLFRRHGGSFTSLRDIDGRNVKLERRIYDYLVQKGYINYLSRILVKAKRRWRCINIEYQSKEIEERCYRLWGITSSNKKYIGWIMRLSNRWVGHIRHKDLTKYKI